MFRFFLSWRYLISRRTNLIGIAGIFLGVFAPILIQSIMTGFLEETRHVLRGNLADVSIEPLFGTREDGRKVTSEAGPLLQLLRDDSRTSSAAVRLSWYGIASQGGGAARFSQMVLTSNQNGQLSAVELVGIDISTTDKIALSLVTAWLLPGLRFSNLRIQDELDATDFFDSIVREPRWGSRVANPLLPFAPPPGYRPDGRSKASVIVGEDLFAQLNMHRGAILHIATSTPHPITGELRPNTREFVVAGSFRSRDRQSDGGRIYLQRSELTDFLQDGREYSELMVSLNDYENEAEAYCVDIQSAADESGMLHGGDLVEVRTWEQRKQGLIGAVKNERVMMGIMLGLVLVVAGFTIFAILSMMVLEKRRDIGILTAIGATPRGILATFLMIGLWDALIGATGGAFFGTWAALRIGSIERWLSSQFGLEIFRHDVFAFDHIPSEVQPVVVAALLFSGIFCTLIFAAVPAWRASRLNPLDALRSE